MGADHLAMNRQSWQAILDSGFLPGHPLVIESFTYCHGLEPSTALAAELEGRRWAVEVHAPKEAAEQLAGECLVKGTRQYDAVTLEVLDAMVVELLGLSRQFNADFDGWGALLPE